MLALFEGPDGGGKTTAAKALATRGEEWFYQHNGPPVFDAMTSAAQQRQIFWWQLQNLVPKAAGTMGTLVDRSWPSEQVYHRFTGRPDTFDPFVHRMFERYMWSVGGVVVMCLPPYHVTYANWRRRVAEGAELITEDVNFATMYEHYASWRTSLPFVRYDYQQCDAACLDAALATLGAQTFDNPLPGTVFGNPGARILVVGEQYNAHANHPEGPFVPFCGTGNNGRWLANQLELATIPESQLAWCNAIDPRGVKTDLSVIRQLANITAVLCLGEIAHKWGGEAVHYTRTMGRRRPPVMKVPHPAYWTRFHAHDPEPWMPEPVLYHLRAAIAGDA